MRLIGGNSLKYSLLILMSIVHSSSLLWISYVLMSPCRGGHWINLGFPIYVAMDRKTENGAEIHNYACERLGIMMRLRIVKYAKNEESQKYDEDNLPHGKNC